MEHYSPAWWTAQRCVAAIREWANEVGAPPLAYEWCPRTGAYLGVQLADGRAKWDRDYPRFPSRSVVHERLGSWPAALEAAGFADA
jgi:hypothetical protein